MEFNMDTYKDAIPKGNQSSNTFFLSVTILLMQEMLHHRKKKTEKQWDGLINKCMICSINNMKFQCVKQPLPAQ